MPYVIGIDIGGTFTDACATNEKKQVIATKTLSTPPDYGEGCINVLNELASLLQCDVRALLKDTSYICHGTTSVLNALVTGAVAKVGFLTTKGHRDSIAIMNVQGRYAGLGSEAIQDVLHTQKPKPLVPPKLVREVTERIDYKGSVIVELNEDEFRETVGELLAQEVEAIAISFLWSFRNPAHEIRAREIIHEIKPDLYIGLSSELCPRIREYSRSTTTIMSTQVGPVLRNYLDPLEIRLRELGFTGELLVMQGSGGTISAREASKHAITSIGSVLTGGIVGCVILGKQLQHKNIISTDMGGTTFLVGMVVDGQPIKTNGTVLNQYTISIPMVDVHTIGSGGGAIAWLDVGGNLKVGPDSAGANPGPACYGQGGVNPTITDADVILGIVNPDYFLGGRKQLDPQLAREAIQRKIAEPLGLMVDEAAVAIYEITNSQIADLLRQVVVNNGHDPRDFIIYAYGGAGPVHCAGYSADVGVKTVLVPLGPMASTFSAFGLSASDVIVSAERSSPRNHPVPASKLNAIYKELEQKVYLRMQHQKLPFENISILREVDVRYSLQLAEIPVSVPAGELSDEDIDKLAHDFEQLYERLYGKGTGFSDAGMQFITYRVFAVGHLPTKPEIPHYPKANGEQPQAKERRKVFMDMTRGREETDIFNYTQLLSGHTINGPAVVEALMTTVSIPAGTHAEVDPFGNLLIHLHH